MARKSTVGNLYWSNAFVAIAQVFVGIAAATFFTGLLDLNRIAVVLFNTTIALIVFFIGRRFLK